MKRVNGRVQVQLGSVAKTSVLQPSLLEGPPVHPLEFSFRQLDGDRQQMQSQIRSLQKQQKELVDGQKIMIAFFEKFLEMRQHEIARDPMTLIPAIAKGKSGMPIGVQVPGFSHRSAFHRLGKQVLLDNQIEGAHPEDLVTAAGHPVVSQGVLSSASVIGTLRWRYPRVSPEHPRVLLEGRIGRNHEFSPDLPARRPVRLSAPPRHSEGRVEDRPADPRRIKVQRRVEDRPTDPQRIEVPTPA